MIIVALLVVSTVALITGTVVMVILIMVLIKHKRRRRQEQRELTGGEREGHPEVVEETSHDDASTHRGEPPPDYREAIDSTEYRSIAMDQV